MYSQILFHRFQANQVLHQAPLTPIQQDFSYFSASSVSDDFIPFAPDTSSDVSPCIAEKGLRNQHVKQKWNAKKKYIYIYIERERERDKKL